MTVENGDSNGVRDHGILHFDQGGMGFLFDASESSKRNELAELLIGGADTFGEHVLQLSRVFSITPNLNGRSAECLTIAFLSDRANL